MISLTEAQIMAWLTPVLWPFIRVLALFSSMPVLGVVLVVGILVSVFQAATQINEATLTFVPKLLAAVAVLGFAGPWMLTSLVEYLRSVLLSLPSATS